MARRHLHLRTFLVILAVFGVFLGTMPGVASAQTPAPTSPSPAVTPSSVLQTPPETPGICAPWHRCLAFVLAGGAGLMLLAVAAGYMWQSRGFDNLEHRQGSPDGVPVKD